MSRRSRTTRIHALILLTHTSWLVCASSSLQAAEPAQPVAALWREQQVEFTYRGDTAVYTCRDLVYRVTTVLRAVGSQPEVTARGQCIDFSTHASRDHRATLTGGSDTRARARCAHC